MKVWVISIGKEPLPEEVFAEGKGNSELVIEEGNNKCQLWSGDEL